VLSKPEDAAALTAKTIELVPMRIAAAGRRAIRGMKANRS
jgi:hypothetical protein